MINNQNTKNIWKYTQFFFISQVCIHYYECLIQNILRHGEKQEGAYLASVTSFSHSFIPCVLGTEIPEKMLSWFNNHLDSNGMPKYGYLEGKAFERYPILNYIFDTIQQSGISGVDSIEIPDEFAGRFYRSTLRLELRDHFIKIYSAELDLDFICLNIISDTLVDELNKRQAESAHNHIIANLTRFVFGMLMKAPIEQADFDDASFASQILADVKKLAINQLKLQELI